MLICIDFDDTIFTDGYPFVGDPIPGAIDTINRWYNDGHTVIINTCRESIYAENAILALEEHGCKYSFFNQNDPIRTAKFGYDPRKIGCDVLIDDRALPYILTGIDWRVIDEMFDDYIKKLNP